MVETGLAVGLVEFCLFSFFFEHGEHVINDLEEQSCLLVVGWENWRGDLDSSILVQSESCLECRFSELFVSSLPPIIRFLGSLQRANTSLRKDVELRQEKALASPNKWDLDSVSLQGSILSLRVPS